MKTNDQKIKNVFSFIILFFTMIIYFSCCKSTGPSYNSGDLQLTVEDVSCTEVWLRLKFNNDLYGNTIKLFRNNIMVHSKIISTTDSLFPDTELEPAGTYAYHACIESGSDLLVKSETVLATTMDSTSHNFTWQSYEFGGFEYGSSVFRDVAVISENDIWVVGEIHNEDTDRWNTDSTEWLSPFNAAHWDGEKWELKRIYYYDNGNQIYSSIHSLLAFSTDDIWFGWGIHWDGLNFKSQPMDITFPHHLRKMWGLSSSDFYIVGTDGSIAHHEGQNWVKITSGTSSDFQDIWGVQYSENGETIIVAIASTLFKNEEIAAIRINSNDTKKLNINGLPSNLSGIWSANGNRWYICGDGLFTKKGGDKRWSNVSEVPNIFLRRIRGNNSNDIFIVGDLGLIYHWNGMTWRNFTDQPGNYSGLAIKEDIVVVAGIIPEGIVSGAAKILIGKRN